VIRFWMEDLIPRAAVSQFACLDLIRSSAVLFEAYLAYGLQLMALKSPQPWQLPLFHKGRCLGLLNKGMTQLPLADTVVLAIALIIAFDAVAGNFDHYQAHIAGLRAVTRIRGGIDMLGVIARNNVIAVEMFRGFYLVRSQGSVPVVMDRQHFQGLFEAHLREIARAYGVSVPGQQRRLSIRSDVSGDGDGRNMPPTSRLEWSTLTDVAFATVIAMSAVKGAYRHLVIFSGLPCFDT
jgi:hypothetical protein